MAVAAGCTPRSDPSAIQTPSSAASHAPSTVAQSHSAAPAPSALDVPSGATACGDHGCLQFDTPQAAVGFVLASHPRVLALGEAHAQKGKESVPSSAKRFTDTILPLLQGKASDLVLELMMPNAQCKKQTEQVREKQKPVTSQQAETNQNEYVKMGERARALGVIPDLLRPSCEDLAAIEAAGQETIPTFLSTIARLTRVQVERLLDRSAKTPADAGKMIVTYGGVLHNDLTPSKEREPWSFGPQLSARVDKRYVELDMFVPEYIDNTDTWRKLEWYPHYDRDKLGRKTTLYRMQPGSFVLIFPRSDANTP
jgi:hypothetical protein